VTRRLMLLLGLCLGLCAAAPAAPQAAPALAAGSVEGVVRELLRDPVFVDPGAPVEVDRAGLQSAVAGAAVPLYVAVLPQAAADNNGGIADLVVAIGDGIGDSDAVVLVVTERFVRADSGPGAADRGIAAGKAVEQALDARTDRSRTAAALTALVDDFVDRVNAQARGEGTGSSGSGGSGSGRGLLVLLLLGGLGLGAWLLVGSRRRAKAGAQQLEDLRADVESLYGRLGSDVSLLSGGDDEVARQALVDAAERYNATGALLATADSPGEFAAARRTAIEGITAARVARQRLGLDLGPDVPDLPSGHAPALTEESRVQVGEEAYEGSPSYAPGRPHYFEGGYYGGTVIPGGWYATPFWQSLLLGGLMGGVSGYGSSYGGGYRRRGGGGFGGFGGFGGGGSWGGGGRRGGGGGGSW
jgi:hypothetical protein